MRAAVLAGARSISWASCEPPVPGPGQVRVRLEGTGVCASNLPVWEGRPWFRYPLGPGAPGHEGWGTVDRTGDGVADDLVGRRVAILSGKAYAEWDIAEADGVVPIPARLVGPCPGEPLGCAVNVVERASIAPGEVVVVVGVGFLGAAAIALARAIGARVAAVSRRRFALDLAATLGAERVASIDHPADAQRMIADITGDRMADCVIEAAGMQTTLDLAATLTRVRGRLVIAGYHQEGKRDVDLQLWNWRGIDVINAHERDTAVYASGMRKALELADAGVLPLELLITETLPLNDLGGAFERMAARPDGFLKAVVTT
jgi:threonine dehydrogenase-like Zn-dependent dehydrogenase